MEEIVNDFLQFKAKSVTLDVKDEIYQSLNKSSFGTDYAINQESRAKFVIGLKSDSEKSGFEVKRPPKTIQAGWATYQSWNLFGGEKFQSKDVAHRFYIAIRPDKMFDVADFLYQKYKEKGIPFYFKLNDATQNGNVLSRKDNLVVYTTNEYLQENLEIMSALSKDCKAMEYCEDTSLITGNIKKGIGYASERENAEHSYTSLIANATYEAMESIVDKKQFENITFDKYKFVFKKQIEHIIKSNPKQLYDAIREQFKSDNIDISNICCDATVMEKLQMHLENKNTIEV